MIKYAIFLNGSYPKIDKEKLKGRIIYCVDGGANIAYENGLLPHFIIGDLDSINSNVLQEYMKLNVEIIKYSQDKDYTDFELALLHINKKTDIELNNRFKENIDKDIVNLNNAEDILVYGATGKRLDMTLANLKFLERYKNMKYITKENETIFYIDKNKTIHNSKGYIFSLFPISDIKKLTLKGFEYELNNCDINARHGLVSNIITSDEAIINFEKGHMYIIIKKEEL